MRRRDCRGMTLVEVLLAAFILGVGLMVLVTASSRCIAVLRRASLFQAARWALDRGEADNPLVRTNDVMTLAVKAESVAEGLTYSREIEEDENEDGLYVVRARVTWSRDGREFNEEVVRYMLEDPNDRK